MRLDINGKECHSLCCVFFYHRNLSTPNNLHRDGGRVLRAEGGVLAHHFRCHVVFQSRLFALKSQKANNYFTLSNDVMKLLRAKFEVKPLSLERFWRTWNHFLYSYHKYMHTKNTKQMFWSESGIEPYPPLNEKCSNTRLQN